MRRAILTAGGFAILAAMGCAPDGSIDPSLIPSEDEPASSIEVRPDTPGNNLQFNFDKSELVETFASSDGFFLIHYLVDFRIELLGYFNIFLLVLFKHDCRVDILPLLILLRIQLVVGDLSGQPHEIDEEVLFDLLTQQILHLCLSVTIVHLLVFQHCQDFIGNRNKLALWLVVQQVIQFGEDLLMDRSILLGEGVVYQ